MTKIKLKIDSCTLKRELDNGVKIYTISAGGTLYDAFFEVNPGEEQEFELVDKKGSGYPDQLKKIKSGGGGGWRGKSGLTDREARIKALTLAVQCYTNRNDITAEQVLPLADKLIQGINKK